MNDYPLPITKPQDYIDILLGVEVDVTITPLPSETERETFTSLGYSTSAILILKPQCQKMQSQR